MKGVDSVGEWKRGKHMVGGVIGSLRGWLLGFKIAAQRKGPFTKGKEPMEEGGGVK